MDPIKVISVIVVAVVIIINAIAGVYDFSSTTTKEIKNNYKAFVDKSLKLRVATILGYEAYRIKDGVIIELDLWNGNWKPNWEPKTTEQTQMLKESIKVFAKTNENSELLKMITAGALRGFIEIQIRIMPNFIILEKYRDINDLESWFIFPYIFSLLILNIFFAA